MFFNVWRRHGSSHFCVHCIRGSSQSTAVIACRARPELSWYSVFCSRGVILQLQPSSVYRANSYCSAHKAAAELCLHKYRLVHNICLHPVATRSQCKGMLQRKKNIPVLQHMSKWIYMHYWSQCDVSKILWTRLMSSCSHACSVMYAEAVQFGLAPPRHWHFSACYWISIQTKIVR